jgi:hypothetical protein
LVQPRTVEDDERLKTLAAQGPSIIKASAALKRKIAGVRARALGCTFPSLHTTRQKWANGKDDLWPRRYVKPD